MRLLLLSLGALLVLSGNVLGQGRVKKFTAPLAGKVVLRDVDDKYNVNVYSLEAPEVESERDMELLRDAKAQVAKMFPRRQTATAKKGTSAVPAPIVTIGFIADSMSGIPPDNYSAVSTGNKGVSVMNQNIAVHDATNGNYLYRKGLMAFSTSVGLNNTISFAPNYRFDPKVVYDPEADRFVCVMLNSTNQYNWIVLAFSQTNDPAGTWNFYKLYGNYANDTTWFDYPAISTTKNEFFLTGNQIKWDSSWQAGFKQTVIYQVNKWGGYNGDTPLHYQIWDSIGFNNKPLRCLYPLNPGNQLLGNEQYFLSNRNFDVSNDSVFLVKVPDTIGGSTALTVTPIVSSLHYGVPPNGRQPDTSITLATNDGRVLGGFIKDNELQFVSESVHPASGASGIYHGIISNFATSPVLTGRMFSVDTLDFGYPNISYAGNTGGANHSIISFEYTGPKRFPGYGAVLFDGSDYSDITVIRGGDSTIKMLAQKEQRWGDYSGSQPDWGAQGAVWVEGIFGRKDRRYGNYMARLASPYFVGIPQVPAGTPGTSKLYPVPAAEYVRLEFSVQQEQVFSFYIYDAMGRVVDKITDYLCPAGKNVIQFNTAPLPPGTYFLRAAGAAGEALPAKTFIRK
ncbi:MAG: T9SS type A sorting domain-containing protein [Bacteroidota bacterium]